MAPFADVLLLAHAHRYARFIVADREILGPQHQHRGLARCELAGRRRTDRVPALPGGNGHTPAARTIDDAFDRARHEVCFADEPAHERRCGPLVDLFGSPDLFDLALAQHGDAIGERECFRLVVRHVNRGDVRTHLDLAQFRTHFEPQFLIEIAQRLIEQQQLRREDQGARDRNALLLTAAELGGVAPGVVAQAHEGQHVVDGRRDLAFGLVPHA